MSVMRKVLLAGSTNAWLRDHATKAAFVRRSVSRFMPGERIEDALRAAAELKPQRINTILTHLGENLTHAEEAEEVTRHYLDVLDKVAASGLDAQISIKPTQLGLDLDRGLCERNLDRLMERAEQRNNFIWIDMESSPYVDPTLDLFRRTRKYTSRIGVAIQAYLYRTEKDIESLIPLGSAIRMVKGAYDEPASVAYQRKKDVDAAYMRALEILMAGPGYPMVGSHDPAVIARAHELAAQHSRAADSWEVQMLYGIRPDEQRRLAAAGTRVRAYVPYGVDWYAYFMRRLAERPANVRFFLRSLITKS